MGVRDTSHHRFLSVPVGAARIRLLFPEQMGKLNGASSCNLLLASPGGKLLSVARLMRGGDRLVNECSWMSGICSGFLHSTGKSETFSYRRPSSVTTKTTVPKCRCFVATASPRGKPRTQKPLAATIQCEFRISKLATPTMLLLLTMVPIFLTYTIVLIFPWNFLTVTV